MKCPVFIDVVESVEPGQSTQGVSENLFLVIGRHFERLELFDFCSIFGEHVYPIAMGGPLVSVENDGKLDLFNYATFRWCSAIVLANGELPCEMIKSTPQIMKRVASNQSPIVRNF